MRIEVLGTGSKGNCYVLTDNGGNSIIIEAGVNFKDIKKAFNFDFKGVRGLCITHEHGDHSKSINDAIFHGIDVYATAGTFKAKDVDTNEHNVHVIEYFKQYKIGPFTIIPFDTQHDVNEPCGFLIHHTESGNILFLTDTTYCKYQFANLSHIIIETNYSESIIQETDDAEFLKNRIVKSHMSIETAVEMLKKYDLSSCVQILLIHLSDRNADSNVFKNIMIENFGINTEIAESGMVLNMNEFAF